MVTNRVKDFIGSRSVRLWETLGLKLRVAQFDKKREFIMPERSSDGAGGIDICTYRDFVVEPGVEFKLETNIAMEIPEGWVGFILPRSGAGCIYKVKFANTIPVIDSDYRGEVALIFTIAKEHRIRWSVDSGDKICQLLLLPAPIVELEKVDLEELSETKRGTGGFGSTGK